MTKRSSDHGMSIAPIRKIFGILVMALAAVALTSCGDNSAGPGATAPELNEEGWVEFSRGEYAGANALFNEALNLDPGLVDARLGLAWSEAQLGQYEDSTSEFDAVILSGELVTDAFAGRSAAARGTPDYSLSIVSADSALSRDPGYFFSRHPAYDFGDLRLILAQSCFALAQYESAQAQVDILFPGNGLEPVSAETWVVGDASCPTYEAALAVIIEFLWSIGGGL